MTFQQCVQAKQWCGRLDIFYIYMPLCAFPGLFNTLLGILTERLALLTIISVGVSEWAVLLGCLQMYNGAS